MTARVLSCPFWDSVSYFCKLRRLEAQHDCRRAASCRTYSVSSFCPLACHLLALCAICIISVADGALLHAEKTPQIAEFLDSIAHERNKFFPKTFIFEKHGARPIELELFGDLVEEIEKRSDDDSGTRLQFNLKTSSLGSLDRRGSMSFLAASPAKVTPLPAPEADSKSCTETTKGRLDGISEQELGKQDVKEGIDERKTVPRTLPPLAH